MHPDFVIDLARERQSELRAEAHRFRLARAATSPARRFAAVVRLRPGHDCPEQIAVDVTPARAA